MPQLQSTQTNKRFYKYTFELRRNTDVLTRHTLSVNPEDLTIIEPARVNVVQTLGGAYVHDFGQGLTTVTISGITGFHAKRNEEGEIVDGWTEFRNFRDEVYRKFIKENIQSYALYWYNWEDDEYFQIQPTSFRLMRSKQAPLVYRYEFQFTCIKSLLIKDKKTVATTKSVELNNFDGISTKLALSSSHMSEALSFIGIR